MQFSSFSTHFTACCKADTELASDVEYSCGLKKGTSAPNFVETFLILRSSVDTIYLVKYLLF